VVGAAYADGEAAAGDGIWERIARRSDERQRTRPELRRETPKEQTLGREEREEFFSSVAVCNVDDERVGARASLCGEDGEDRRLVEGVRTQTIHRLGRKGHQPACAESLGGLVDRVHVARGA
jgi:hypothetical protein|tara:strand:- start:44 stop:409 length:366 start_codon:yes stop_codon:yes gene_type:complete